jgi:hypothetical protein
MITKGNGYDEDQYKLDFVNHSIYTEIIKKDQLFHRIKLRFDSFFYPLEFYAVPSNNALITVRLAALQLSCFSIAPIYYLDFLLEKNPTKIIDIGCGANVFKRIIPCIHGIDPVPNNPYADEVGSFDDEFSHTHKDEYESVFSINAVHFISLIDFEKRILEFINIVKPGGRGFVTFNMARMLERTNYNDRQKLFNTPIPDPQALTDYVNLVVQQITQNTTTKFLLVDLFIDKELDEIMNGNIRLVFEK